MCDIVNYACMDVNSSWGSLHKADTYTQIKSFVSLAFFPKKECFGSGYANAQS